MPANTLHVKLLIERLADKTGQTLDYYGFGQMSELLANENDGSISQRYLDDLYRNTKKLIAGRQMQTRPRMDFLNIMARFLGYDGFMQFSRACEADIPEILRHLTGNWWSYVRSNSGRHIFKAPVKIEHDMQSQQIIMHLQGQERSFRGQLKAGAGCAFAFLDSASDKRIGIVFKLGSTSKMNVLQGTFCGISSSGDPIAGREVLVREEKSEFARMVWQKLRIDDDTLDPAIRAFFAIHGQNCIKINKVSQFNMEDLS